MQAPQEAPQGFYVRNDILRVTSADAIPAPSYPSAVMSLPVHANGNSTVAAAVSAPLVSIEKTSRSGTILVPCLSFFMVHAHFVIANQIVTGSFSPERRQLVMIHSHLLPRHQPLPLLLWLPSPLRSCYGPPRLWLLLPTPPTMLSSSPPHLLPHRQSPPRPQLPMQI